MMQGMPTEVNALKKKVEAISSKLESVYEELKDLPRELKQVRAEIKILKETQQKEWLDGHDVALALSISSRTLQYIRNSGQLPFSQFHNKRFYKASDVNAILETNYLNLKPIKKS